MKALILISLFVVTAFITVPTFAAPSLTVTLDENGNGTFNGSPLIWGIGPSGVDPTPPGPIPTLFYNLPFKVLSGDWQIIEPDGTISDVLRFIDTPGTTFSSVYVYSERETSDIPPYDLADTQIPQPWAAWPALTIPESGTENGWNGVIWTPGFNDPGATSAPITYDFTSDVPEPATICLLGLGALTMIRRRRSAVAKN